MGDIVFYTISGNGTAASSGMVAKLISSDDKPMQYEVTDELNGEQVTLQVFQILGNPRLDI